MAGELHKRKVLLAVAAGDPEHGVLRSAILSRFQKRRRPRASREETVSVVRKLSRAGLIERVSRARGAVGLRLTEAGHRTVLQARYDLREIVPGRFSGRQMEEAVRPLREELARVRARLGQAPARLPARPAVAPAAPGAVSVGAVSVGRVSAGPLSVGAVSAPGAAALEGSIVDTARRIADDEAAPGRLIAIHSLRDAVSAAPAAFDQALWRLVRANRGTLHKRNDEAGISDQQRAKSFRHPFTRKLLFYFRPPEDP